MAVGVIGVVYWGVQEKDLLLKFPYHTFSDICCHQDISFIVNLNNKILLFP